jgi:imidazolonepropionase-like amidohydrolase
MNYMGGEVDTIDGIRTFSRLLLKQGVDFLKMVVSGGGTPGAERILTAFTVDEVHAARDEARRFGAHLAVHASNLFATRLACVNRKVGHRVHREGGQGTLGASA